MILTNLFTILLTMLAPGDQLGVTSPSFKHRTAIPPEFTCEGKDMSPMLSVTNIPANTKSLVVIMDDPDAPKATFDHWILWNIPPNDKIGENYTGGISGRNGTGNTGYKGPCPPSGTHRYFFRVYAIDIMLSLKEDASKREVEDAIRGHVLASGELIGLYKKIAKTK